IKDMYRIQSGALIIQFGDKEMADWVRSDPRARRTFAEAVHPEADIRPQGFTVLLRFIPLTFDPDTPYHLRDVEEVNQMPANSIIKAQWIKPPQRRDPSQICGHAYFTFSSVDTVNLVL
ncbi:hypothetical protein FA95DRAFT_1468541, partial [Auriscalpium vulgare]